LCELTDLSLFFPEIAKSTLHWIVHLILWYAESSTGRTGHLIGENQYTAGHCSGQDRTGHRFGNLAQDRIGHQKRSGESAQDRTDQIRWEQGTGQDTIPDRIALFGPGCKSNQHPSGCWLCCCCWLCQCPLGCWLCRCCWLCCCFWIAHFG
jgi:hypothetical protein